jgi:hypothetical protein
VRVAPLLNRLPQFFVVFLITVVPIVALSANSYEERYRVVDGAGLPVGGVPLQACEIKWPLLECVRVLAVAKSRPDGTASLYIPDYLYHGGYIKVELTGDGRDQLTLLQRRPDKFERGQWTYREEPATVFAIWADNLNVRALCSAFQGHDAINRYTILPGQCGEPRNLGRF